MFEPGQRVVIRGRCLGTVISVGDLILVEELDLEAGEESRFEIPTERALEEMRPIVGKPTAERVLAIARQRAPRPDHRASAYRKAIKSGDLDEQAQLLAASYAGPQEPPEIQYQERLEKSVFGELALVLGKSRKSLRAQVRAVTMTEAPSRALTLPDMTSEIVAANPPLLTGLELLGAFAVNAKLAVGESRADVAVEAVPGIWFAYASRDTEDEDDLDELIAVHRDHVAHIHELERSTRLIGKVPIEGAHIAIFDEALADDPELFDAIGQTGFDILEDRCAAVGLPGDGVGHVRVAPARGRAAYVRVELGGW